MRSIDLLIFVFLLFAALFLLLVIFYIRLRRKRRRLHSDTLLVKSLQPDLTTGAAGETMFDDLPELIEDLDASLPGIRSSTFAIQPDENRVIVTINGKNYDNLEAITNPDDRQQAEHLLSRLLHIRDSINAFETTAESAGDLEIFQKGDRIGYRVGGKDYDSLDDMTDPAARARAHQLLNNLMRHLAQ